MKTLAQLLGAAHDVENYKVTPSRKKSLGRFKQDMTAKGIDIRAHRYVADIDASPGWFSYQEGVSPTLTRSRGGTDGFYFSKWNMMMTTTDMGLLQGFSRQEIGKLQKCGVTDTQLGQMFGNGFSKNSLERIIGRATLAADLLVKFKDPWSGDELTAERNREPDDEG